MCRRRRRRRSRPRHEVDRHGDAFELEALTQLILDPIAVVARDVPPAVDGEAKTRRARVYLSAVEDPHRRLAPLLELPQEAVEVGGRGGWGGALEMSLRQ